jgi:hypothetical protein
MTETPRGGLPHRLESGYGLAMTETPRPSWDSPSIDPLTDVEATSDNTVKVRNALVSVQPTT